MLMLLIIPVYFYSCSEDDDGEEKILLPKLDGFYVFGTNTIAESPSEPAARMALAVLDHGKLPNVENEDGVYGRFMYIGANSEIRFAEVVDEVGTVYGDVEGGTATLGTDIGNVPVNDMVIHGTLEADEDAIEIEDEGLYYVFVNVNTGFFSITRVKVNMIGDTTPGNWATGTFLDEVSVRTTGTVFEKAGVTLKGESGYRWRFTDGWHFYDESGVTTTLSSLGVFSYGESWPLPANDVGFFLDNAPHQTTGIFTVRIEFDQATGEWTETKTKTGEVLVDYSSVNMAIIGSAITGTCFCGDGTGGFQAHDPVKVGNVYTWTWNDVSLLAAGDFIFLEDATWPPNKLLIDYTGATVNGTAVPTNVNDATLPPTSGPDHNYHVITAGVYDITLVIDAAANTKTVTINNN